jgi:hypothetical protein
VLFGILTSTFAVAVSAATIPIAYNRIESLADVVMRILARGGTLKSGRATSNNEKKTSWWLMAVGGFVDGVGTADTKK